MTDPAADKPVQNPTEDQLLDHNYDGIQEYDNPLPGWWVAIFIGSIIWSFIYFGWYHSGPGRTMIENYGASMERLDARRAEAAQRHLSSYGELKPDQATMLKLMADEELMASQDSVFQARCAVCHLSDGRGLVGPNMTDDAYIHIRKLEDFIKIVTDGVIAKGMTPFKGQLSEQEIIMISAYMASLRGKPLDPAVAIPPKAAQGEVIPPWPEH